MYRYPLNGGGDKRAGAALPIFAKKRPRVALMAFSNSQTTDREQTVQHHRQDKSSVVVTRGQLDKENTASSYGGKETSTWSAYQPVHRHVTTVPDTIQSRTRSNPRPYWEESHDLQSYDVHVTKEATSSSSTNITNSDQPLVQSRDHVTQSQLMNSVHLLTATSQGVQHWAGYQQHINLMFEVFGTLSSLIEQGEMGAKRFMLQAVDGPLNCLFWEIDYKIPATLTRGRLCRVVGKWDAQKTVLKCVSIRLANPNEWNSVKTMVATSDKYMRQMASSFNEL